MKTGQILFRLLRSFSFCWNHTTPRWRGKVGRRWPSRRASRDRSSTSSWVCPWVWRRRRPCTAPYRAYAWRTSSSCCPCVWWGLGFGYVHSLTPPRTYMPLPPAAAGVHSTPPFQRRLSPTNHRPHICTTTCRVYLSLSPPLSVARLFKSRANEHVRVINTWTRP